MTGRLYFLPPVSATLRSAELSASTVPLLVEGRLEPVASKKYRSKRGVQQRSFSVIGSVVRNLCEFDRTTVKNIQYSRYSPTEKNRSFVPGGNKKSGAERHFTPYDRIPLWEIAFRCGFIAFRGRNSHSRFGWWHFVLVGAGSPPNFAFCGESTAWIDLGEVYDCARISVNDKDFGTSLGPVFLWEIDNLKPGPNRIVVEVSNVAANRIRDLDQRGVNWKNLRTSILLISTTSLLTLRNGPFRKPEYWGQCLCIQNNKRA